MAACAAGKAQGLKVRHSQGEVKEMLIDHGCVISEMGSHVAFVHKDFSAMAIEAESEGFKTGTGLDRLASGCVIIVAAEGDYDRGFPLHQLESIPIPVSVLCREQIFGRIIGPCLPIDV
jgi:hypothetical protein